MTRDGIIRPINLRDDLDAVIELWYEASISAHDFIESSFWESSKEVMREMYIPNSQTMVLEEDDRIIGFVCIFEDKLQPCLFQPNSREGGLGRGFYNGHLTIMFSSH